MLKLFRKLINDDSGGEVLEYAIVAGLIVVGAIAFISLVGGKVKTAWDGVNGAIP